VKVVVLGSGGSWPSRDRNPPAVALKLDGDILLFDCAEGTQRQFMLSSLSFMQVRYVLLSHLHADHFLGLPGLAETMALNGRKEPLHVFGPKGSAARLRMLFSVGYFSSVFELVFHDLRPGEEVQLDGLRLRAVGGIHQIPSLAYAVEEPDRPGKFDLQKAKALGIPEGPLFNRLQSGETVNHGGKQYTPDMVLGPPRKGRKIVYTGDTSPSPEIVELARDCDLLIHDSTADAGLTEKANRYGHSSNVQAAQAAVDAGALRLLLVHVSPRFGPADAPRILEEAQEIFPETVLSSDLMELDIGHRDAASKP
jgi:ribonuclease Z